MTAPSGEELQPAVRGLAAAAVAAIIIGTLYFGREVFVPIALAILLSFVLAPLVRLLQRWHIPRGLSVISVVFIAFMSIFALGGVIATQVAELAGDLPQYQFTMREKIKSLRGTAATSGTLERAADVLQDLGKELNKPKDPATSPTIQPPVPSPAQEPRPIPVEVRQPPPTALESIAALISPLLRPLTTTGITAIFVIFILLQREDLRNRFIKLAGSRDLQKTTAALDDATTRLSRLFLIQLALNTAFGVVIGTGLWIIGIPNPVLWGILAAVLRFVPYVGAAISAVFPLTLAAAVDPGWAMLLWTAALFLVVEPLVGHGIEPLLYGHSTGLSPVAIITSATFWTALWGPVGLVLATPLTICLVVLGRHVERLEFLEVMFGDRPALSPPELFYQRMLAEDPPEAVDKAEEFLKASSLSAYYDEVALPGLKLAQDDIVRGALDRVQNEKIKAAVVEVVDDLVDQDDQKPVSETINDAEATAALETVHDATLDLPVAKRTDLAPQWQGDKPVLCVAGRGPLDEAAAIMLAQLLEKHGLGARVEGADAVAISNIFRLDTAGIGMVCLSYLDAGSPARMRYAIRRMRRRLPQAQILLGCWRADTDTTTIRDTAKPDAVATTLREAVKLCLEAARNSRTSSLPMEVQQPDANADAA
ncbi:MAG TPA: AI-2E family transporter [Steroidobacteraceae bacterium]|nr:AI-2E family transporter [Steroidobacteraceae bacterium]